MSGYPNIEQVQQLLQAVDKFREAQDRIEILNKEITNARTEREALLRELNTAHDKIKNLVRAMDCESTGNLGWQNRIAVLLAEFQRQIIQGEQAAPKS